jgi:nitrogen fixation protein FixH
MPVDLTAQVRPRSAQPFRLSGRMVAGALIGFFLVVAGVNAVMMTIAITTMPGVDVKSAYETSQRFNGEIARMQAQEQRGWQASAQIRRSGADAVVTLSLRDNAGAPVTGLLVEARLEHPAARREDHAAPLNEGSAGDYTATIPEVHGGRWTLAVQAARGTETVFVSRSRVVLKD